MSPHFINIEHGALQLPANEQLKLARTLLENAEACGYPGVEEAWEDEIERRIQMLDSGLAKGRAFSDVLQEIDHRLER